ncbi:acetyltransferase [Lachnospiraceae bacterium 42-17]
MDDIILVGAGGHAKSIIDSIEKNNCYRILGFTDIMHVDKYRGYPYLGNDDILNKYFEKGVKYAFITLGFLGGASNIRTLLYEKLKNIGYKLPVIIDPSAIIASDVKIGEGSFIGKGCIVNSAAHVEEMCIINTGAVIEHDNEIGSYSHISVNSTLCGNVTVGSYTFIGANATIIQGKNIGSKSIIGAGSIILRDIFPAEKVYGVVS